MADIIIVNWNGGEKIVSCVRPLLEAAGGTGPFNILVPDNGSTDNSVATLVAMGITVIENKLNLGFAAACNRAFPHCKADYIILLNPDAIATPGVLMAMINKLAANLKMACIGPRQLNAQGETQRTCGRFPNFINAVWELTGLSKFLPKIFTPAPIMTDWPHNESKKVDHIMGSCMVLRKSLVDEVGFMDERFFVYLEDLDLSKRMHDAGYFSYYDHESVIFHEGGGLSSRAIESRLLYSLDSKIVYWKKHFSWLGYRILYILALTLEPLSRISILLATLKLKDAKITVKVYRELYRRLYKKILS